MSLLSLIDVVCGFVNPCSLLLGAWCLLLVGVVCGAVCCRCCVLLPLLFVILVAVD